MPIRYVVRVKDPATLETMSEIKYLFSSVANARNGLIDMLIRAKQFPIRLEIVYNRKWVDDTGIETYSHIVATFPKRGNEKIYYHINKIDVTEEQIDASEKVDTPSEPVAEDKTDINPFDILKSLGHD